MSKASKAVVPYKVSSRRIILPSGGPKGLRMDDILGSYEEWVGNIVKKYSITKNNVVPFIFLFSIHLPHRNFLEFLKNLITLKLIDKYDLVRIYKHQSLKRAKPFLELHEISKFSLNGKSLFSKKEILRIVKSAPGVSSQDVLFLLSDEYYKQNISLEVLELWLEGEDDDSLSIDNSSINSLAGAFVAKELSKKGSELISLDFLEGRIRHASGYNVEEGTLNIFLEIMFDIAEGKPKKWGKNPRRIFTAAIMEMLRPTGRHKPSRLDDAKTFLTWYISNPTIPKEDREWVESEVTNQCNYWMNTYKNFVTSAKSRSPFNVDVRYKFD